MRTKQLRRNINIPTDCHSTLWTFLLLLLMALTIVGCDEEPSTPLETYKPRPHFITTGDAIAGRQAFLSLECHTCHQVAGESWRSSRSAEAGPQLGSLVAEQSADEIAMSIVSPSHAISPKPGIWRDSGVSNMRNYADQMTVRQFLDIVAYIRSLPPTEGQMERSTP